MARVSRSAWLGLAVVLALAWGTAASEGDRDERYARCVWDCVRTDCYSGGAERRGLWDRLVRWECGDECRYQCQQQLTAARRAADRRPLQFHGKWPFRRLLGMQEALSVLFSAANLAPHLVGVLGVLRARLQLGRIGAGHAWMWSSYLAYGLAAMHAWLWSCVFHTRDLPLTEWADHVAAAAFAMAAAACALVRAADGRLAPGKVWAGWAAVVAIHAWTMRHGLQVHRNLLVAGAAFALATIAWLLHCRRRPPGWKVLLAAQALGWAAVGLELGDFFVPQLALDAHASWHLATIVPGVLMWRFAAIDLSAAVPGSLRPDTWRRLV